MKKEEVLEIFKETGGILKGHFLLTSGRHSDTYMQCAKLFMYPEHSKTLCAALAEQLKKYDADIIASPAIGGIIMGYEVAAQLGVINVFFERQEGAMTLRRGFEIPEGARVIVVEDVVTTGGSVKEVIKEVKNLGGNVVAVASIVDRSNGVVDFGYPYEALLSMEVISYDASECPICKNTDIPVVKPGSRVIK